VITIELVVSQPRGHEGHDDRGREAARQGVGAVAEVVAALADDDGLRAVVRLGALLLLLHGLRRRRPAATNHPRPVRGCTKRKRRKISVIH